MTIRWQIFLSVVLLFLGVGVVGSGVGRWLEMETVRASFDEEAHATAVAVAEFIEPADVAALKAGTPFDETRLGTVWGRLNRWAIVKRLFLLDPGSGRVLADTDPAGPPPSAADAKGLAADEARPLAMRTMPDGSSRLLLVALVAQGSAVVGVEVSAEEYLSERAAIFGDMKLDLILAILAGVAVGAVLSHMVSHPIQRLGLAVEKIGAPNFSSTETESVIQEVADVGNTLGVMHSVLGETVEKARLALHESDYYRSEAGLAAAFRRELQPPAVWSGAGAEAVWLPVGSAAPAALAGALTLKTSGDKTPASSGAAFAGVAGAGTEIEPNVRARAAGAFLADALARLPLAEAAADTQALFGLSQLVVARWQDGALELWRGGGEAAGGAVEPAAWKPGAPLALACLGAVNRERVNLYLANFASHTGDRLLAEIPPLLDAGEPGIVLVLRRK